MLEDPAEIQSLPADLKRHFQKTSVQQIKLEKRLVDSNIGQLHRHRAQQVAAKALNQMVAGKKLPSSIISYLFGMAPAQRIGLNALGGSQAQRCWLRRRARCFTQAS